MRFPPELRLLMRRMLRATGAASEPVPIGTWRAEVERLYTPPRRRPSTCHRVRQAVREASGLVDADGTTADLTAELVERYAADLAARPIRAETAAGLLRGLRAACTLAVERGWLDFGPFLDWSEWPAADDLPLKSRHHSRSEVARVLGRLRSGAGTWEGGRLYTLAMSWSHAGLRLSESLRLRAEDLDFEASTITVRRRGRPTKTRASAAAVPMPDHLATALRAWLPRVDGTPWIFPGLKRVGPWTGGKWGSRPCEALRLAAEAAGVQGMTPHTLRHSLSTHLRGWRGLSPKQLQMILRHSNVYTQELYCKRDLEDLVALVRDLDYSAA
jgi:integrase/recombinase XerD